MPGPVVGTIVEGSSRMPFHTDLRIVLDAFGGRELEFDWLVTDLECCPRPAVFWPERDSWLLTGDELHQTIFHSGEPIQFIWGVLSGTPRGDFARHEAHLELPAANGNHELWTATPSIQYPEALVEVVCWDSSATLLITEDSDLTRRFRAAFPEADDLFEVIARAAGRQS